MQTVELEMRGDCAWIWFRDPKGINAMTRKFIDDLAKALDRVEQSSEVRSVVIASDAQHFSVGLDLKERAKNSAQDLLSVAVWAGQVFGRVAELKIPTLALLRGYAYGGAIELVAGCDCRFAETDTKIAIPAVKLGIFNPAMLAYRLPRLIGLARSKQLMLLAGEINASTALGWGLIDGIYPAADLIAAGERWADTLSKYDAEGLRATKRLLNASLDATAGEYARLESEELEKCFNRDEAVRRIATFLQSRK